VSRFPAPLSANVRLVWSGRTHRGRFRSNNEDAFLTLSFNQHGPCYLGKDGEGDFAAGDFVFAVSDGMGGAHAGEFASKIAVQKIAELLPRSFRMRAMGITSGKQDFLAELMTRIHREMRAMGEHYEECAGMGATLSLVWLSPTGMVFAHVGDTRIYYLPAIGPMRQITHDHTHAGWLFREGKINEREAKNHPSRNQLQMALGGKVKTVEPQIGSVIYEPGDRFVIVSDGVVDGVWDRSLERMIREPAPGIAAVPPAQRLIDEALFASGRDNLTALVLEINPGPSPAAPRATVTAAAAHT
jgi:PPM family protein phosphatase